MFQSQKKNEEIKRLEQQLAEKEELLREVSRREAEASLRINRLEECQLNMEKSILAASDYFNSILDSGQHIIKEQREIRDIIKKLLEKTADAGSSGVKELVKESDLVSEAVSNEKSMEEHTKEASLVVCEMKPILDKLAGYSSQMGVFALNAAIEAGKMGDSGRSFVNAAEQVRKLALEYQEQTGSLEDNIKYLTDNLEVMEHKAGKAAAEKTEIKKEQEQLREKLQKDLDTFTDSFQKAYSKEILSASSRMEALSNKSLGILEDIRAAVDKNTELNEFFTITQEELKKVKEIQQKMGKDLKLADPT